MRNHDIRSRVRSWVRAVLCRSRMKREIDAELRFRVEAYAEDLVPGRDTRGGAAASEPRVWRHRVADAEDSNLQHSVNNHESSFMTSYRC